MNQIHNLLLRSSSRITYLVFQNINFFLYWKVLSLTEKLINHICLYPFVLIGKHAFYKEIQKYLMILSIFNLCICLTSFQINFVFWFKIIYIVLVWCIFIINLSFIVLLKYLPRLEVLKTWKVFNTILLVIASISVIETIINIIVVLIAIFSVAAYVTTSF